MSESTAPRLGGRYEIRGLIGHGGMAEVDLGFDTRLNRVVAIKRLRSDLARDTVFQQRFRREAQSAASLNHPNIVAVYDTGDEQTQMPDGSLVSVPYIVMEYVQGHTVKELLSDGTAVPIDEAVEITTGVLSALAYAHSARLVHRDIKPGNIMLTPDGKVKVMDFGIARALSDSQATMTQTNAVVGTAQYLSPEQARGEVVDARSDLYSVGVLLFELLTGQPPFRGDSAVAVAYQHVSALPPAPSSLASDIPESLDRVVMKALAKDPNQRYSNAAQMRTDLSRALHGVAVEAPETAVWAQMAQPAATNTAATTVLPVTGVSATQSDALTSTTAIAPVREEEIEEKKKPIALIVAMVVLALVALAGGSWLLFGGDSPQSDTAQVQVPASLTGMTQDEARQAIESAGLVFSLGDEVTSDSVPIGKVAATNPPSGTMVPVGSTVKVSLSSGPDSVVVPENLVGMTLDEARRALEGLGLKLEEDPKRVPSDTVAADRVVQVNPSPGQKVKNGSTIRVSLSSGPDNVPVPNIEGMTQDQARKTLTDAGLSVGNVQTVHEPFEKDRVIRSQPAANETVKRNSAVTLIVASGNVAIPTGLEGQSQDAVVAALGSLGLTVEIYSHPNDNVAAGNVFRVDPSGGQFVAYSADTRVKVYVSTGPAQPAPGQPGQPPAGNPPAQGN